MKKLAMALAVMFAATLFSGNAFAFSAPKAAGVQASTAVVKVHHCYRCHRPRRYYSGCGCNTCGCYRPAPVYYYYPSCGSCYGGCGWGGYYGGWGWGGFGFGGWFW